MPKSNTLPNYDLTYEQAHAIASGLDRCDLSGASDQDIGLFLALLRAFTYSDNRETLLCAVEAALLPMVQCAGAALDELVRRQTKAVRETNGRTRFSA
jgi:hypothetical protein